MIDKKKLSSILSIRKDENILYFFETLPSVKITINGEIVGNTHFLVTTDSLLIVNIAIKEIVHRVPIINIDSIEASRKFYLGTMFASIDIKIKNGQQCSLDFAFKRKAPQIFSEISKHILSMNEGIKVINRLPYKYIFGVPIYK